MINQSSNFYGLPTKIPKNTNGLNSVPENALKTLPEPFLCNGYLFCKHKPNIFWFLTVFLTYALGIQANTKKAVKRFKAGGFLVVCSQTCLNKVVIITYSNCIQSVLTC